jgi:hypothetical protein
MEYSKEIFEELNQISTLLAGMEKKNVFSVPFGYFDTLYIDVLKKIEKGSDRSNTLTVPAGYFEGLADSVLNKIRAMRDEPSQELRELSPMLYSIQNENVFTVPNGYFNGLESEILSKVKPQAKVIELKKRDSVWKYAAAAVVTGMIGLSSLMMFNSQPGSGKISEDQTVTTAIKDAKTFTNEKQLNEGIASLSDEEIIKYLEKTGNDVDGEVLSSSVDDKSLPAPTDYLLDEKILDTYLEQSDKNSQN